MFLKGAFFNRGYLTNVHLPFVSKLASVGDVVNIFTEVQWYICVRLGVGYT